MVEVELNHKFFTYYPPFDNMTLPGCYLQIKLMQSYEDKYDRPRIVESLIALAESLSMLEPLED